MHMAAEMMELTAPPQNASLSASPVLLRAAALDTQNGVYLLRGLLDMLPAPLNKEV